MLTLIETKADIERIRQLFQLIFQLILQSIFNTARLLYKPKLEIYFFGGTIMLKKNWIYSKKNSSYI